MFHNGFIFFSTSNFKIMSSSKGLGSFISVESPLDVQTFWSGEYVYEAYDGDVRIVNS